MMIHRRSLIASAAAMAAVPRISIASESPRWQRRAEMPWPTQEIYCAVLDGKVYVAGGLIRDAVTTRINDRMGIYDPSADVWSEGPRLPQPRHHPMLAAARNRLWAFGGYDRREGGEWTSMTDYWALDGDVWHPVGQMPQALAETVGVTVGDRVHLVTGRSPIAGKNGQWNEQEDVATHLVFDASDNRWTTASPAPEARNSAAAAGHGGHIYVAGGRMVQGGRGRGRLDRYDPQTDRWDTLSPIPVSDTGHQVGGGLAIAAVENKLVAFGGEWLTRPGGVFTETWIYDIGRDVWSRGPDMGVPRHGLAGCTVDGVVYAIAGGEVYSGGKASGVVEALRL